MLNQDSCPHGERKTTAAAVTHLVFDGIGCGKRLCYVREEKNNWALHPVPMHSTRAISRICTGLIETNMDLAQIFHAT